MHDLFCYRHLFLTNSPRSAAVRVCCVDYGLVGGVLKVVLQQCVFVVGMGAVNKKTALIVGIMVAIYSWYKMKSEAICANTLTKHLHKPNGKERHHPEGVAVEISIYIISSNRSDKSISEKWKLAVSGDVCMYMRHVSFNWVN